MSKISLLMLDDDETYLERLRDFVRTSDYCDKFAFRVFTRPETLERYLRSQSGEHVVVANRQFIGEKVGEQRGVRFIALEEGGPGVNMEEPPVIGKYQPLTQLFSSLYDLCGGAQKGFMSSRERFRIVSVYSAFGGAGKTVFALSLSRQLALSGKKVFYLSLETVPGAPILMPAEETDDFPEVLYYLKTAPDRLASKITACKKHDPFFQIDYFASPPHVRDAEELTEEDTRTLLNAVSASGEYDYVIVDLEATVHERVVSALKTSALIFWLLQEGVAEMGRSKALMAQYRALLADDFERFSKRIRFILNKWRGEPSVPERLDGWEICAALPYVPEWKTVFRKDQLFSDKTYHLRCQTLCRRWILNMEEDGI